MPSHGKISRNAKDSSSSMVKTIHRSEKKKHRHRCHSHRRPEVEHRDDGHVYAHDLSTTSNASSMRSDHDEENNSNNCNKSKGTDDKLLSRSEKEEKIDIVIEHDRTTEEHILPSSTSSGIPMTMKKDVHYYTILARIHKAVNSVNNTPSLGSILADANKRGMSLDAVIELYKEERFKAANSRQVSCEDNLASPKVARSSFMEGGKDAENVRTAPCDFDDLVATILSEASMTTEHQDDVSVAGRLEISEVVDREEIATHDGTCPDSDLPAITSAQVSCSSLQIKVDRDDDFPACEFDSKVAQPLFGAPISQWHRDDISPNALMILSVVSSEVTEDVGQSRQDEPHPDPPGNSSEDEPHPDPPGLSHDDRRDADSCSSSSIAEEHHDTFDNCVEMILKERPKVIRADDMVTKYHDARTRHDKPSLKIERIHFSSYLDKTHRDPPGQSYSSTIDSDDADPDTCSSSSMANEYQDNFGSVVNIESEQRSEAEHGCEKDSSHSKVVGSHPDFNVSSNQRQIDDRSHIRNKISRDVEGCDREDPDETRPDPPGLSSFSMDDNDEIDADSSLSSSTTQEHEDHDEDSDNGMETDTCSSSSTTHDHHNFDNGVEIILKASSTEEGFLETIYSDDVGNSHRFSTSTSHEFTDETAGNSHRFSTSTSHEYTYETVASTMGIDSESIVDEMSNNIGGDEDSDQLDIPGRVASPKVDEDDAEFFGSSKTPKHQNTTHQQLDTFGGFEIALADGLEESIFEETEISHSNDSNTMQDHNDDVDDAKATLHIEVLLSENVQDIEDSHLDVQENASSSANDPDDMYTGSYFGSSSTHVDDFDNGVEIVLEESEIVLEESSKVVEIYPSYTDDVGTHRGFSETVPQEHFDEIAISTMDIDKMKLWKDTDAELNENSDQHDHNKDLSVQASSSNDEEESQTCSGSSSSGELQRKVEHTASDGFDAEMVELSRIFNQATVLVNETLGIPESDEENAVKHCESRSAAASSPASEDRHELNSESDANSSGLDDSQLAQFAKKAEELIENDLSPGDSNDAAADDSAGKRRCREASFFIDSRTTDQFGEVDAFFTKFSIQTGEKQAHVDYSEGYQCNEPKEERGESKNGDDFGIVNEGDELKSHDGRRARNTILKHDMGDKSEGGNDSTKIRLNSSVEANSYLPNHLGLWKSPWQKTSIHRRLDSDIAQIGTTETYASSECSSRKQYLNVENRLLGHAGYSNIDFYSLYEASLVKAEEEDIDQAPWECRDVGQRFLHEKSLESRNWFGSFELIRGNDRLQYPVCCPKSLEVSVTRIPEEGDWSEDWFTTWKSRKDNPNNLESFAQDEKENMVNSQADVKETDDLRVNDHKVGKSVVVEIGSLCPVRVRPGERISRIHPEFTSSLRQSRWRKKYIKGYLFSSA